MPEARKRLGWAQEILRVMCGQLRKLVASELQAKYIHLRSVACSLT
jgi:hypothetical protein